MYRNRSGDGLSKRVVAEREPVSDLPNDAARDRAVEHGGPKGPALRDPPRHGLRVTIRNPEHPSA